MKKTIVLITLMILMIASVQGAAYLKLDDIDGESVDTTSDTSTSRVVVRAAVEPAEEPMDVEAPEDEQESNFGVLLSSGSDGEETGDVDVEGVFTASHGGNEEDEMDVAVPEEEPEEMNKADLVDKLASGAGVADTSGDLDGDGDFDIDMDSELPAADEGSQGGNAETTWKVEKGEKAAADDHDHDKWIDVLSIDWSAMTAGDMFIVIKDIDGEAESHTPSSYLAEVDDEVLVGLLLPAVQKVRAAASNEEAAQELADYLKNGEAEEQAALLLPAVQKAQMGKGMQDLKTLPAESESGPVMRWFKSLFN